MPASTVPVEAEKPKPVVSRAKKARRRADARRWIREARGILALAVAGFAIVSLAIFDPALSPSEQATSVGPVGWWLGWFLFRILGYAGFLLPLLLGGWGVAAFVRPKVARGWVPLAGLGVLLVAAAGLLQLAADTFVAERVTRGGIIATGGWMGWVLTTGLLTTLGRVGAWLLLLAAVPVGVLLVTQASYAAVARLAAARSCAAGGRCLRQRRGSCSMPRPRRSPARPPHSTPSSRRRPSSSSRPGRAGASWSRGSRGRRRSISARAAPRPSSCRRSACSSRRRRRSSSAPARSCRTTPRSSAASCRTSRSRAASCR